MSRKRLRCGDRQQLRSDLREVHRLLLALRDERGRGAIEADERGPSAIEADDRGPSAIEADDRGRGFRDDAQGAAPPTRFSTRSAGPEPDTAGAGDDLRVAILRALRELAALLHELDAAGPGPTGGSSPGRA